MANDIDIIVGVKDLATSVLDRLSLKANSMAVTSKLAFAGAANQLNEQLAKAASGAGNGDRVAKAIDSAMAGVSAKIDQAINKTSTAIDTVNSRIQTAIATVTNFVVKAAKIATIGAAFITVGRGVWAASGSLADFVLGSNKAEASTEKLKTGVLSSLAPFSKYIIAAGATVTLTNATLKATSATSSLVEKVIAVGRGALAAFILRNALKKTEDGASTLSAKLAKVAGFALAFDVAARASVRFGLSLFGIGKKADEATLALFKTQTGIAPLRALASGASAAALSTRHLITNIEDLPRGAESINSLVTGFGNFAAQIGGIPGLLLAIPAGIAGIAFAAITAAGKTERQITLLTNKLAIVEAAKLNLSIEEIDTAPLRKVAEETAKVAKQIQTATNVQSSKLVSLATSALPKGLDSSQIGDAMKAAVGLAEVYGTSIEDGMYRTRQAIEGNFEAFEKLIPAIKTMTTNEEKIAAVSRLAANGLKITNLETLTFWGTIERVKNGLGNLLESFGQMNSMTDIASTLLRDVLAPAVEFAQSKLAGFGFDGDAVMGQATSLAAGIIAALETVGSNSDIIWERLRVGSELFWVQIRESTSFFVTNTLPYLLQRVDLLGEAFGQQARKAQQSFNLMTTSAMEYAGIVPTGTYDFQKAEYDQENKKFKPKESIALPERQIGEREQSLLDQVKDLDSKLATAFTDNYEKTFDKIDKAVQDNKSVFDVKLKVAAEPPAVDKPETKSLQKANAENSVLQSRFLARGQSNDPQREMANTLKRHEALLQRQLVALEKKPIQPAKLEVELIT